MKNFGKYACRCGNVEIKPQSHYCCSNANCTKAANGDITCSHGQILPFTQKCNHECPYAYKYNRIAISATCDYDVGCPSANWYSKICINFDHVKNKEIRSFCDTDMGEPISCTAPLNSKWSYEQCYTEQIAYLR